MPAITVSLSSMKWAKKVCRIVRVALAPVRRPLSSANCQPATLHPAPWHNPTRHGT